jgi:putative endonuclease
VVNYFWTGGSTPPHLHQPSQKAALRSLGVGGQNYHILCFVWLSPIIYATHLMFYVYVLQSINFPDKTYIGYSTDVQERLIAHNNGQSTYTNKFKPWKLLSYSAFDSVERAHKFEQYLKTASGRAFAHKRLM